MKVHLVDGTYELFRHYHALPRMLDQGGQEVAAVRGVIVSLLGMVEHGATHLAVATDHVIESFRNEMWPGYKNGEGIEADLVSQFPLLEEALAALGVVVWPMVEFEADDALASGARAAGRRRASGTGDCLHAGQGPGAVCCGIEDCAAGSPQARDAGCGGREGEVRGVAGVDTGLPGCAGRCGGDGYPGLAGWGAKSAAAVLARFDHLEGVPQDWRAWHVNVANPRALSETLREDWEKAMLFRDLATLRNDIPLFASVDELRWTGTTEAFPALAARFDAAVVREKSRSAKEY